jgi:ATP-dependent exoDNAse (exonuclease V) beta subunit
VGFTRARDKLIVAHRDGACDWLSLVPEVDRIVGAALPDGEHNAAGIDTTCVVKRITLEHAESLRREPPSRHRWLSKLQGEEKERIYEQFFSPSEEPEMKKGLAQVEVIGEERGALKKMSPDVTRAFGTAVHAFFAALPSMTRSGREQREAIAKRCLRGFGAEGLLVPSDLVDMGESFLNWVQHKYPGAVWKTEVPVSSPRQKGGQWNGSADLLLELPNNELVVVDHKSTEAKSKTIEEASLHYDAQLAAYREILETQGRKVTAIWIHMPMLGAMVQLQVP